MKINHIVADLEYCKELKELGLVQKSIFVWVKDVDGYFPNYMKGEEIPFRNGKEPFLECSAWTASELGEMLPKMLNLIVGKKTYLYKKGHVLQGHLNIEWNSAAEGFSTSYHHADLPFEFDKNLANGLAKMLIYLLKNNIISLEEVNSNL